MSLITIPAIAMPNEEVMWQREPLICAFDVHHSFSTSCWLLMFSIGFSSLYTHMNLRLGVVLLCLNFLRRARANGSPFTLKNSAFLIMKGSRRRAAPMDDTKVIWLGRAVARSMRSALSFSESMASMMKSYSSMWNSSAVSAL